MAGTTTATSETSSLLPSSSNNHNNNKQNDPLSTKERRHQSLVVVIAAVGMLMVLFLGWTYYTAPFAKQQTIVVEETTEDDASTQQQQRPLYRELCEYYPSATTTNSKKKPPRILQTSMHEASQPWSWKECFFAGVGGKVKLNTARSPDAVLYTNFSSSSATKGPSILGFGGAVTEATALNFQRLSPTAQETTLELLFDPTVGLGYTITRVPIHSCDFSVASYNFDPVEDDFALDHFDTTVQHDVDNGMIPFLQRAQKMVAKHSTKQKELKVLASPWSPPAWMKRPTWQDEKEGAMHASSMTYSTEPTCLRSDGGDYAATWAQYIRKWIHSYATVHDIPIWAVTVQNEPEFPAPWEACAYTADVMAEFVEQHLGPVLAAHTNSSIFGFDHNKDHVVKYMDTLLQEDTKKNYIAGTAYHWYAGGMDRLLDGALGIANLHRLRAMVDSTQSSQSLHQHILLGTEACHCPTTGYSGGDIEIYWARAERYAHTILADLAAGSQGWIEWNMVLDSIGGPNHLGNLCDAPILSVPHRAVNASSDSDRIPPLPDFEVHGPMGDRIVGDDRTREELNALGVPATYLDQGIALQPLFHYTGHISKYVRPGATSVPALVHSSLGDEGAIFQAAGATVAGGGENNLARNGIELLVWPCEGSTRQQFRWNMKSDDAVELPTISVLGHDWLGNPTESCVARTNDKDFLGVRLVDCDQGEAGYFTLAEVESDEGKLMHKVQLLNPKHRREKEEDVCLTILQLENEGGAYGPLGGAQVRFGSCDAASSVWSVDVTKGVAKTHYFEESALCMTTGWPFLQMGAFVNEGGEQVVVILNEARDAANYALQDDEQVVLTNSIPPRSIQTVILD